MPDDSARLLAAASEAATGPGKPARVRITRPASAALWCGIGALTVLAVLACLITGVFAFAPRPAQLEIWLERDKWLGLALLCAVVLMAAIAIRLSWTHVSAAGGPAHIDLGEGGHDA